MGLFLLRFWPALLPLLVYLAWRMMTRLHARRNARPVPDFRDGSWYWVVISTLTIALICFIFLGHSASDGTKGRYIPPHMKEGTLIPGHVADHE